MCVVVYDICVCECVCKRERESVCRRVRGAGDDFVICVGASVSVCMFVVCDVFVRKRVCV